MDSAVAAQVSETVAEKVLQYRRDASGWKICRESNGVSVSWRPSVEFPGNLYRGEGIVCGTPEEVWDCVKPAAGGLREKWDENVTSFEVIQSITDNLHPLSCMKLNFSQRFVDVVLVKRYEDGTISSNATHWEHPLCPQNQVFVRGFKPSCEPNKTNLVTFFQTDLSGYPNPIPTKALWTPSFPHSMTSFYANLQKAVKKIP
uniref:StAR related lipid transfer domain containing 5 n=1 Tax=Sciurus vulgaris TaxID=55149 RepID=A0A8D2BDE0_SCIVU